MNARKIVQRHGLSPDPGAYVGRGATTRDLTATTLRRIYDEIKGAFGDDAAQSFVTMVKEFPKLSAEAFLQGLYRLEAQGWKWSPHILRDDIEMIRVTPISTDSTAATTQRDETNYIRGEFLERISSGFTPSDYDPYSW